MASIFCLSGCIALPQSGVNGSASWLPRWVQSAKAQPVTQPAAEQPQAATFIVRFNNEPDLAEVAKSFRRDGAGARAKFNTWCSKQPGIEGLVLVRASYSGELVLGLPHDDPQNRTPDDILTTLKSMDNLAYADIDAVAHPVRGRTIR